VIEVKSSRVDIPTTQLTATARLVVIDEVSLGLVAFLLGGLDYWGFSHK
jgi:hypothetical protein